MSSTTLALPSIPEMEALSEAKSGAATKCKTPEDGVLMERGKEGDSEAFRLLFERHKERLRRLAYLILHDKDSAEDAVQETFERCISAIQGYRGDGSPRAWLSSITLNVCRH